MRSFFVFVILLSSVSPLPGQVSTADIRALVAQALTHGMKVTVAGDAIAYL